MKDVQFSLGWLWLFVFFTLSLFFVLAERRYRHRGFGSLAAMTLAVGLCSGADAAIAFLGPGLSSFWVSRMAFMLAYVVTLLNSLFLCAYFDAPRKRIIATAGLVLVIVGVLGSLAASIAQAGEVSQLAYPNAYRSPSLLVTVYFIVTASLLAAANVTVVYPAMRQGQRPARGILATLVVSSPAAILEGYLIITQGQRWYLIEASTWAYLLIVIATIISEFKGTEGLLQQTTSNLAARTAELESSYAEIDLMASELARKQQLAAVGELAAAIAHEVRNPLAIIMNAVSGMKRATISPTDRGTLLDIVNEESERLNQLVAELLRFARPVTAARSPISLYDICERASQSAPPGYQLKVQTFADDELGPVLVDPGLFRLALDNLIANSCQSMPGGGIIELAVRQGRFSDGTLAAAVDVRDQGAGMRPEELANAKKPFFTTKPRGTGLGIPIAEKIVEAHGGEMDLVSVPGLGTTVSIMLPLERELQKGGGYSDGLKTANRRRLRSIPPVLVAHPNQHQEQPPLAAPTPTKKEISS